MLEYKNGDIFDADTEAIVNTVNCVGIMGRGIALQFKKRFPENFDFYEKACKNKELIPGTMLVYETGKMINPKFIINFPTKRHWRGASRIEDVEKGLVELARVIQERKISSIAIPPLGCGLGGLDWNVVKQKMEGYLSPLNDVKIVIFQPGNAPVAKKMAHNHAVPNMTPGRAALIGLVQCYLNGLLAPVISLLEVHKLLYFIQEAGEPLRLEYVKAPYGPYAENLRHVLNKVEGYFLSGYADGGDNPRKELAIVPGAEAEAQRCLKQHPSTAQNIERITELVDGYETPFGLELLATVHWIVTHEKAKSVQDVVRHTYAWNDHKKQFSTRQIELAVSRLTQKGWIPAMEGSIR